MNFLRAKNKKPFSVRTLSELDWQKVKDCEDMECGVGGWFTKNIFRVPNFWMKSDCKKHDLSTRRGGMVLDWIENATGFFKVLFEDLNNIFKNILKIILDYPVLNYIILLVLMLFGYVIGFIIMFGYWIGATIGTIFVFNWSQEYKDLETILKEANKK